MSSKLYILETMTLLISVAISGCATYRGYRVVHSSGELPSIEKVYSSELSRIKIEMSLEDFRQVLPDAYSIEPYESTGTYILVNTQKCLFPEDIPWHHGLFGDPEPRRITRSLFFYFSDNKLLKWGDPNQTETKAKIGLDGSAPITFSRLIFRVPSGTEIGAHHDGLLEVPKFRHTWLSSLTIASDEFRIIACEYMKSGGYTVIWGDDLLFQKAGSGKAEYQLGGTVTWLEYNTYAPLAGDRAESTLRIEWELFDVLNEEVVYKKGTRGYGQQVGIGIACIQTAFKSALGNLMADSNFVKVVKKSPLEEWKTRPSSLTPVEIARCTRNSQFNLPEHIESAMDSILLIRVGTAVGSGVVISEDGYALTAAHVVSGVESVSVGLHSGLELMASVIRSDTEQDIALIKLQGRGHSCLPLVTDSLPKIGSDLFAIGTPMGESLAFSVTKGVVSGIREWESQKYLQTDATLNPGNSGGPLLSVEGYIVGIVSWKVVSPGFEGLAFGVPIPSIAERLAIIWK